MHISGRKNEAFFHSKPGGKINNHRRHEIFQVWRGAKTIFAKVYFITPGTKKNVASNTILDLTSTNTAIEGIVMPCVFFDSFFWFWFAFVESL